MAKSKKRKSRKHSANRLLYMKERRRISNMVRRLRQKGNDISIKDIAGDIPKRVTKQAIHRLKQIKSSKQAFEIASKNRVIPKIQKPAPQPEIYAEDLAIQNFRDKFSQYHAEVEAAINKWIDYVLDRYGEEALMEALDAIEYEGVELSSYGGYLIPPGDLELYLHKISHFIVVDGLDDLSAITEQVTQIISEYDNDLTDYETADWGSWSFTGTRSKIGLFSELPYEEKLQLLRELGLK